MSVTTLVQIPAAIQILASTVHAKYADATHADIGALLLAAVPHVQALVSGGVLAYGPLEQAIANTANAHYPDYPTLKAHAEDVDDDKIFELRLAEHEASYAVGIVVGVLLAGGGR